MKKTQLLHITLFVLLAAFISSCSMRYSDTGKPFDFLKAKNMGVSKKQSDQEVNKSNKDDLAKSDYTLRKNTASEEMPVKKDTNDDMNILLIILAILIPFLAVGLYEGITTRFWISLILSLLFWIPGIIYAILVVTGTI